ncbi:type II toxin-antitoxin system prevent-host-death family antitoxin [Brevibacterium sp.]|uniref:type II toxin-antitoxin system Phd/YefM family antitoxin n=1 Tax=Brevibacterium sp. TaxID=1701 RepID=UPI002810A71B|nr:type II toxin-antitoxin system prevent-host-death family antitoxin [Brevibacterium sp.]
MNKVSKRELNQHTASVLEQVLKSGDIVVTERGQPRWRVTSFRPQDSTLARLEHEGRYSPPSEAPAPWPEHPGGPPYTEAEVDALLSDEHGDH